MGIAQYATKSIGAGRDGKLHSLFFGNHPVTAEQKVGRNDPCPCGSGKKHKKCHGK